MLSLPPSFYIHAEKGAMFFIRHPRPVVDPRAVAVLVVQQKVSQAVSRTTLIVEKTPAPQPTAVEPNGS